MTQSQELQKYRIEGLDCASCANEIESALRKLDGFDGAVVSFSTGTILVPAEGRERAQQTIDRVEPGARIVDRSRQGAPRARLSPAVLRVGRIVLALLLTGAGVLFGDALRATWGSTCRTSRWTGHDGRSPRSWT